jgi:SagB-type dehydrogenase family enzyme
MTLESALLKRRSRRHFRETSLTAAQVSRILWAAYGYKYPDEEQKYSRGIRTCPSAGALYPLDIYLVCGNVEGIETGFYLYRPEKHALRRIHSEDLRKNLFEACLKQEMIRDAPATLLYATNYDRVSARYGDRGADRYVPMDIGHSAQNVYLQAEAMGLGTCAVGAFDDAQVKSTADLKGKAVPLYLLPLGVPVSGD